MSEQTTVQDFGENRNGLQAKKYDGKWAQGTILEEPTQSSFKGKNGVSFPKFTLKIQTADGKAEISNLVRSQLNRLVNEWSPNPKEWIGKTVHFTAEKDGDWYNWELYPKLPVSEEKVR